MDLSTPSKTKHNLLDETAGQELSNHTILEALGISELIISLQSFNEIITYLIQIINQNNNNNSNNNQFKNQTYGQTQTHGQSQMTDTQITVKENIIKKKLIETEIEILNNELLLKINNNNNKQTLNEIEITKNNEKNERLIERLNSELYELKKSYDSFVKQSVINEVSD